MKVILRVYFDCLHNVSFDIENPPVIPIEGDIVDFKWDDFITDKKALKELWKYDESGVWCANIISKRYTKSAVLLQIVLFREKQYGEHLAYKRATAP